MSKYTITIKNLLDNGFDFGLKNYPIFDEKYRSTLNQNILYHYYESEIGLETPELFKFYLNQKLNEIMPYYNVLYEKQKSLSSLYSHVPGGNSYHIFCRQERSLPCRGQGGRALVSYIQDYAHSHYSCNTASSYFR